MNSGIHQQRPSLQNQPFQLIVIGGGINGVAIARECARSGRRTLLLEQNDFAAGTTSRSTRIIHGGLRYLEQGEFGLVRESLRERRDLLRQYPHLVHPLQFLLALGDSSERSSLKIRTGLWLYRMMTREPYNRGNIRETAKKLEKSFDSNRKLSVFDFQDAQCEFPERLVAEWLVEAIEAGATARNHTQVLAVDVRQGRAAGVLIRDLLSGKEERVEAAWIINATGPWADRICQRSSIKTKQPMIGGVRGSHIVLPRFPGATDAAVYSEAVDGRPFFVIPWNEQTLVGTTEVEDTGDPGKTRPSTEEVTYLLQSFAGLFPKAGFSRGDVRYAFSGVRPLPYAPKAKLAAVSRRHYLHNHKIDGAAQMISVIGGKLTTAAELARECAAAIGGRNKSVAAPASTRVGYSLVKAKDFDPLLDDFVTDIANAGGISETSAAGVVEWHGKRSTAIAQMAISGADFRATLCPHTEHIVAEAVDAFTNECAVTLGDVLLRRVPVALGACWSEECAHHAVAVLKPVLGWTNERAAAELDAFEQERQSFLGTQ